MCFDRVGVRVGAGEKDKQFHQFCTQNDGVTRVCGDAFHLHFFGQSFSARKENASEVQPAGKTVLAAIVGFKHKHGAVARHAAQFIFRKTDLIGIIHDVDQLKVGSLVEIVPLAPLKEKDVAGSNGKVGSFQPVHRTAVGYDNEFGKIMTVFNLG